MRPHEKTPISSVFFLSLESLFFVMLSMSGGTKMQDHNYTYDANGNITQIIDASQTNSSKTVDYVYDDLNRLTSATATNVASGQSTYTHTYTYNAIGNILTRTDVSGTYTYAGDQGSSNANPHAATSIGSVNYTYDNNGNLLTETSGLSNTWDYNNRLTQAVKGAVTSTYDYDHAGQRVKLANGTITTHYPSKFYNIEGSNRVKHIFAGGQLIATVTGTGASAAVFSLHTDHLTGSNVVTNSGGTQEELMDYFPFGNIRLDQKAGSFGEQRKFAGSEYDTDSQLNYMVARYYKSDLGRFISQDPVFLTMGSNELTKLLENPQALNSYSYANNNPLVNVDFDGNLSINVFGFLPKSTQISIGDGANYLYDNSSAWQTAMDHPVAAGVVIGVGSAGVGIAGSAGLTAVSTTYLGGAGTACLAMCSNASQQAQKSFQAIGKAGEALSGLTKNTQRIPSATGTANYRIPDGLDKTNKVLSEVKNVGQQSYTNQLKDFASYAKNNGYKFELYTRPNTQLSQPLQQAAKAGEVILKVLGKSKK